MKKIFKITAGYQWEISHCDESKEKTKNKATVAAIRKIVSTIQSHADSRGLDVEIDYSRLRASAGRNVLQSINKKIKESQVVIFDITLPNRNVFLELGIALARAETDTGFSVYLIKNVESIKSCCKVNECEVENWVLGVPSDLMGFYISRFEYKDSGDVIFDDNGSLYMSILRDVVNYINDNDKEKNSINEFDIADNIEEIINEKDV